jgi:hypothetical protein
LPCVHGQDKADCYCLQNARAQVLLGLCDTHLLRLDPVVATHHVVPWQQCCLWVPDGLAFKVAVGGRCAGELVAPGAVLILAGKVVVRVGAVAGHTAVIRPGHGCNVVTLVRLGVRQRLLTGDGHSTVVRQGCVQCRAGHLLFVLLHPTAAIAGARAAEVACAQGRSWVRGQQHSCWWWAPSTTREVTQLCLSVCMRCQQGASCTQQRAHLQSGCGRSSSSLRIGGQGQTP